MALRSHHTQSHDLLLKYNNFIKVSNKIGENFFQDAEYCLETDVHVAKLDCKKKWGGAMLSLPCPKSWGL